MSLHITPSKGKLTRFPRVLHLSLAALAILALVITALPSRAATPQPQAATPLQAPQTAKAPNATCPPDGQCFADVPSTNPFYTFINRIYQQDIITGYACGGTGEPCDPENRPYYRPVNNVTRQQMAKFVDQARRMPGISIDTSTIAYPLVSYTTALNGTGVVGQSTNGTDSIGVYGSNTSSGTGVSGFSASGTGVQGQSISSYGLAGYTDNGTGVYGLTGNASGNWAGYFQGNVNVSGTCCNAGAGTYRIDDPLDPQNKYLYHSAVQSPDMMNVYNGNVTTDATGDAVVTLPDYFQALNRDYRYQLTVIGQFAQAIVSEKVKDNHFSIKTDKPNVEVSWQVTGIRQDPYANAHRIPIEEDKPADEKGKYLHPTEWGQPESKGIDYEERHQLEVPQMTSNP